MKRGGIIIIICILLVYPLVAATTFVSESLEELDKKADYVVIGNVESQTSIPEKNGRIIGTETTIIVEEWLKGYSAADKIIVKEMGGIFGDVMMVVPGTPQFKVGERVALFVAEEKEYPNKQQSAMGMAIRGHTVGMAQGKFSIVKDKAGNDILINELHGANLLVGGRVEEPVQLTTFRAHYQKSFFTLILLWLYKVAVAWKS